jgi:hypothetical protein
MLEKRSCRKFVANVANDRSPPLFVVTASGIEWQLPGASPKGLNGRHEGAKLTLI